MRPTLVLFDVDGTLVTAEKVLTPRAAAAVKALQTGGIAFAITSGRPPRGLPHCVKCETCMSKRIPSGSSSRRSARV